MTEPGRAARRPNTPTVQQGQSSTSRRRHASVPTMQQGVPGVPTVEQGGPGAPSMSDTEPSFPDALRDRFEPLECRGRGTEGAVWRCRRVDHDDEVAVKVNWVGRPMDQKLLEHLGNPTFHRHVPRLHAHGILLTHRGEVAWVAMEFFEQSLGESLAGRPQPPEQAVRLLEELANALEFWQQVVDRNPLDFKPDNLMIRRGRPDQIVIADFGGVSAFTASQQQGGPIMAAVAYSPPEEVWNEKRTPWPWWALGEICYLMITGRTRFQQPTGEMARDEVIKRRRHVGTLDLDAVADPRWQLLIRGLLTRDSNDRWVAQEVRLWLDGGSPPVAQAAATTHLPAHRPVTFVDGRAFTDPGELAVAMLDNWRQAAEWLTGTGRQLLLDWLLKEKLDHRFDTSHLRGLTSDRARLHSAVLAFGASFAPEVTPRFRGQPVDPAGLVTILASETGFRTARDLVESGALGIAGGYRCTHHGCTGPRCAVLDRAAADVTGLVPAVEEAIAGAVPDAGRATLTGAERDRLCGLALLSVIDPDQVTRLVRRADRWRRGTPAWWRTLRARAASADPRSHAGRVAILTAAVLRERAFEDTVDATADAPARVHVYPRVLARRAGAVVAMFGALVLVAWLAGVLGLAEKVFAAEPQLAARAHVAAPSFYLVLAPALLVLAAEAVVFGRGRAGWLVGACAVAAGLALAAPRLPAFTAFSLPGPVDSLLGSLRDAFHDSPVLGTVLFGSAALGCLVGAARLVGPTAPAPNLGSPSRRPAPRVEVFGVLVVLLPAVLWAAGVLRLTILPAETPRYAPTGTQLAYEQAAYILIFLLAAAIGALAWNRNRGIFAIALLAAAAAGLWAQPIPELGDLRYPVAIDMFTSIAALWGAGAFWMALLGYVPLTLIGYRLATR